MRNNMKNLALVVALAVTSVAFGQGAEGPKSEAAAKAPAFKAHVLSVPELDKALADPDKVLVIDVRRPDEVSSNGGFPVYLSVQISDLERSLAWIPKGRPIITVSNHAARAGKAADLLSNKGFKVIGAVGSQTYEQAGGKLVTHIPVPAPKTAAAH
jgi:rhodanese-related sulfurtransferase